MLRAVVVTRDAAFTLRPSRAVHGVADRAPIVPRDAVERGKVLKQMTRGTARRLGSLVRCMTRHASLLEIPMGRIELVEMAPLASRFGRLHASVAFVALPTERVTRRRAVRLLGVAAVALRKALTRRMRTLGVALETVRMRIRRSHIVA